MADTENRGSKESLRRGQSGRKRREPPFIEATATELPADGPDGPDGEADPLEAPREPAAPDDAVAASDQAPAGVQAEPVLFGAAARSAPKPAEERVDHPVGAGASAPASDDAGPSPAGELSSDAPRTESDLDSAAAAEDSAAPEGSAAALEPRARRRWLVPALLGILILATLGSVAGLFFWAENKSKELSSALAGVQGRLGALEQRPDPAAKASAEVTALDRRTDALDNSSRGLNQQLASLKGAVADLQNRLAEVATKADASAAKLSSAEQSAPAAASPPPAPAEVAALSGKLDELSRRIDAVQSQPQPTPPPQAPVDLGPIEERLAGLDARSADLGRRVEALAAALAGLPKPDLAPLQASVAGLDRRLGQVETALASPKTPDRVTEARAEGSADEARAAPLAVVAQALAQAIAEGRPFGQEFDALRKLGVDDASLAPLAPLATKGAPTLDALSAQWSGVKDQVLAAGRPKRSESVLDRLAAGARNLVQVRQLDAGAGEDPGTIVARIDSALERGDLRGALAERDKLPEAGRAASQSWADAAQARLDAENAAQALVSRAIATLARTKG